VSSKYNHNSKWVLTRTEGYLNIFNSNW